MYFGRLMTSSIPGTCPSEFLVLETSSLDHRNVVNASSMTALSIYLWLSDAML